MCHMIGQCQSDAAILYRDDLLTTTHCSSGTGAMCTVTHTGTQLRTLLLSEPRSHRQALSAVLGLVDAFSAI